VTYSPQGYATMRARIKRDGTCASHVGVPVLSGQTKCEQCVRRRKQLRQEYIAAGVCPVHPQTPIVHEKKCCQVCLDEAAARRKHVQEKSGISDTQDCGLNN
jgi:hypothetical protein